MFTIPIPPLLAIGFLIGVIILALGYRENSDLTRRNHLMGIGIIIIGVMIPITPLSWYGYLIVTSGLILGIFDIIIIGIALILGIILLYVGFKTYTRFQ
ncbi:MAG: hypothetical protein ACFFBL_00155 [Promethearchaeota archaeon]